MLNLSSSVGAENSKSLGGATKMVSRRKLSSAEQMKKLCGPLRLPRRQLFDFLLCRFYLVDIKWLLNEIFRDFSHLEMSKKKQAKEKGLRDVCLVLARFLVTQLSKESVVLRHLPIASSYSKRSFIIEIFRVNFGSQCCSDDGGFLAD